MLILPIKKKWFDMIKSGEKKEEYREIKEYYSVRLGKHFFGTPITYGIAEFYGMITIFKKSDIKHNIEPKEIIFRNGYKSNSPQIKCKCNLSIGYGKEEWGAESGKKYYVLKILEKE